MERQDRRMQRVDPVKAMPAGTLKTAWWVENSKQVHDRLLRKGAKAGRYDSNTGSPRGRSAW